RKIIDLWLLNGKRNCAKRTCGHSLVPGYLRRSARAMYNDAIGTMTDQGVLGRERFRPRATALEAPVSRPDRLDSWKEIARHLGREVRTVQLWEKREGLPVHRHFHRSLSSVFAF